MEITEYGEAAPGVRLYRLVLDSPITAEAADRLSSASFPAGSCLLVDCRDLPGGGLSPDIHFRLLKLHELAPQPALAVAVVVKTQIQRLLATSFALITSRTNLRSFMDEASAMRWLRNMAQRSKSGPLNSHLATAAGAP